MSGFSGKTVKDETIILDFTSHLEVNQGRAIGTCNGYFRQLERLVTFLGDREKSLLTATQEDLEVFTGIHLHELGVSPRSRKLAIAAIRGLYKWCCRQRMLNANPAEGIRYPKTGRKLPYVMPLRAAEKILMQCDLYQFTGVRNAAVISVLMGCGLRVSGVSKLNQGDLVADVDEEGKEACYLRVREKGDHERIVPVPDECYLLIRAYLGHVGLDSIDRSLPDGDQVLFVNTRHPRVKSHDNCGEYRRLSPIGIRRMLVQLGEQAGIPREFLHPHALRHLYGTELIESDVDILSIQALMGHRDTNSTKIYTHLSSRRLRKAVDKGGPLGKIQTPVSGLIHLLRR